MRRRRYGSYIFLVVLAVHIGHQLLKLAHVGFVTRLLELDLAGHPRPKVLELHFGPGIADEFHRRRKQVVLEEVEEGREGLLEGQVPGGTQDDDGRVFVGHRAIRTLDKDLRLVRLDDEGLLRLLGGDRRPPHER